MKKIVHTSENTQTKILRHYILVIISFLLIFFSENTAFADIEKGVVAFVRDDIVVIEYGYSDYCGVELYSGTVYEGNVIIAETFKRYGTQTMYNATRGSEIRVYVDDYMMSKSSAEEWIIDHL